MATEGYKRKISAILSADVTNGAVAQKSTMDRKWFITAIGVISISAERDMAALRKAGLE